MEKDYSYLFPTLNEENREEIVNKFKERGISFTITEPMPTITCSVDQKTSFSNPNMGFNLSINGNENTLGTLLCVLLSCIKGVYYNNPYTTVKWGNGTATTVKCTDADQFSMETGFIYCVMKRILGDTNFHNILKNVTKNGKDIKATKLYKKLEREAKKREAEERNGNDNT